MKYVFVVLCLLLLKTSCKNNDDVDCTNFVPAPPEFSFTITNSNGDILIGEDAVYDVSELSLIDDNSENAIFSFSSDDSIAGLSFKNMQSGGAYVFNIGDHEDTLILTIEAGECGARFVRELMYNGSLFQSDETGFFTLIKN